MIRLLRWAPALILAAAGCATWWTTGSLARGRCTHVGVRPASDGWGDVAATLQLSSDVPVCRQVYPEVRHAQAR
jgi:hypothetical protein